MSFANNMTFASIFPPRKRRTKTYKLTAVRQTLIGPIVMKLELSNLKKLEAEGDRMQKNGWICVIE